MNISKDYRPELLASQDPHRTSLHHAWLDVGRSVVWATNGMAAVRVPVELDKGEDGVTTETSGYVHKDALVAARKENKRLPNASIHCNGGLSTGAGIMFPRPAHEERDKRLFEENIPNQILASHEKTVRDAKPASPGRILFSFRPALLAALSKAMGLEDDEAVTIEAIAEATEHNDCPTIETAMFVTSSRAPECAGIIMPCRKS